MFKFLRKLLYRKESTRESKKNASKPNIKLVFDRNGKRMEDTMILLDRSNYPNCLLKLYAEGVLLFEGSYSQLIGKLSS